MKVGAQHEKIKDNEKACTYKLHGTYVNGKKQ
jgi:hypothetical protein